MKRLLLLAPLIITISSSSFSLSQPIQLPVITYDEKPPYIADKTHKRCMRSKSYWKCIDRSEQKVTTSLDIDY